MPNACGGYDPPGGAPMAGSNNTACNAAHLVNHSLLPQAVLDRACGNVLRQKFALGCVHIFLDWCNHVFQKTVKTV